MVLFPKLIRAIILCLDASIELKGLTSITSALERNVFEQLHPHLAGGPGSGGILLHQDKVRVMAVQGIH